MNIKRCDEDKLARMKEEHFWIEKALAYISIESQMIMSGMGSSNEKKLSELRKAVLDIIHGHIIVGLESQWHFCRDIEDI